MRLLHCRRLNQVASQQSAEVEIAPKIETLASHSLRTGDSRRFALPVSILV